MGTIKYYYKINQQVSQEYINGLLKRALLKEYRGRCSPKWLKCYPLSWSYSSLNPHSLIQQWHNHTIFNFTTTERLPIDILQPNTDHTKYNRMSSFCGHGSPDITPTWCPHHSILPHRKSTAYHFPSILIRWTTSLGPSSACVGSLSVGAKQTTTTNGRGHPHTLWDENGPVPDTWEVALIIILGNSLWRFSGNNKLTCPWLQVTSDLTLTPTLLLCHFLTWEIPTHTHSMSMLQKAHHRETHNIGQTGMMGTTPLVLRVGQSALKLTLLLLFLWLLEASFLTKSDST